MIEEKFVDLYARNCGLRDKLVAERDVVLTYALRALLDTGLMDHLAFKGGTCLRKLIFGSNGRFSEDLDFTLDSERPEDDVLADIWDVFSGKHYGVEFALNDAYKTPDNTSFGASVCYRHAWNGEARFKLQVSLRERPTLPAEAGVMKKQVYFRQLEFGLFDVRSLALIEMIAEKVRAACQRVKVRDIYDLHCFAAVPFDGEILRRLVVLKLWQVKDRFDPDAFFEGVGGDSYDWADIERLVRRSERIEPTKMIESVVKRFQVLGSLTDLERQVIADAKSGRNERLADRLRDEIRHGRKHDLDRE